MKPFYACTRFLIQIVTSILYSHKTLGAEHAIAQGCIIAATHSSYFDPPFIAASWPYELSFLARSGLFDIWWLKKIITKLNAFPLSESGNDLAAMRLIGKLVQQQRQVVIFPEGHRSNTDEIQPLQKGCATLAVRNNCPIIPCYVAGTYKAWPPHQKKPCLTGRTACVFGAPIYPYSFSGTKKEQQIAVHQELEKSLHQLKEQYDYNE